MTASTCDWCQGPMPGDARRDAVTCSERCRQARWRFRRGASDLVGATAPGAPARMAYADPPYPGKAGYYRDHPDYGGEVDHAELVARLEQKKALARAARRRADQQEAEAS